MNIFTAVNTVLASVVQVVVTICSATNRFAQSVDNLAYVAENETKMVLNDSILESEEKLALGNARIEKIRADILAKQNQQSEE